MSRPKSGPPGLLRTQVVPFTFTRHNSGSSKSTLGVDFYNEEKKGDLAINIFQNSEFTLEKSTSEVQKKVRN